jgi:glycine hydroxymethyltransferase
MLYPFSWSRCQVIDDTIVYHYARHENLVVVNASNDKKTGTGFKQLEKGCAKDRENPSASAYGRDVVLHNLKDPAEGKGMRVDIALQGPKSRRFMQPRMG